jgi:DNA replication protein DnaC
LLQQSQVPKRHRDQPDLVGGWHHAPWHAVLVRLERMLGSGFLDVLMGGRGTGKTMLTAALIAGACRQSMRCHYVRTIDLFAELRLAYRPGGPSDFELLAKFTSFDLLVLDEVHELSGTPFECRLLTHLIDKRYGDKRDTLLATNDSPDDFKTSVGPSIVSRIQEAGAITQCDWPSFRAAKQAAVR